MSTASLSAIIGRRRRRRSSKEGHDAIWKNNRASNDLLIHSDTRVGPRAEWHLFQEEIAIVISVARVTSVFSLASR